MRAQAPRLRAGRLQLCLLAQLLLMWVLAARGEQLELQLGRHDTTTALQQQQLVAVANDGLNKRDRVEQQQLVQDVTNLVAAQVAAKVEQAAQQQTQAVADLVQRQAGGGGGGQLASGGGTDRNGAPFQTLDRATLVRMIDKDPDRYDDYLAMQHNKSTEIAGHRVLFPKEEDPETILPLRYSAHKCTGPRWQHRVCHFYNLLLWNGTFLYITDDTKMELPEVQLTYIGVAPFIYITNITAVTNATDPGLMPFDWGTTPKIVINDSLIFYMSYHNNYGHLMGETAPLMHSLLCTYFGRCSYSEEDRAGLQVLLYNTQPNVTTIMPRAVREELWPCFSKHPLLRMNDGSLRGKAVLLKHAVAGVGPSCRGFPWCRARFHRVGPAPMMMSLWKERIHKCVGLPVGVEADYERPNLVIINRPLQHGRGFINAQEVAHRLEAEYKNLTVHVEELNEESLSSQAGKYCRTDILVQMHGAALGNLVFLPKGAIYVDVVPELNEDKHTWAFFLGKDLSPLLINPVALKPQRVELMESIVTSMPEWKNLTEAEREMIVKEHKCPDDPSMHQFCTVEWFMKRSNSYLDYEDLKSVVALALESMQAWKYKLKPEHLATQLDMTDMRPDRELYDLV